MIDGQFRIKSVLIKEKPKIFKFWAFGLVIVK